MSEKHVHVWMFDELVPERPWKGTKHTHRIQYRCMICRAIRIGKLVNRDFLPEDQGVDKDGKSASEQK